MEYEYVLEGEIYPDEAVKFLSAWESDRKSYIADDAALDYYDDDPDPEYFPVKMEIYSEGKSIGKFEIFLEFEPSFSSVER